MNYPTYPYMPNNGFQNASNAFQNATANQPSQIANGFVCRPVTSREEAVATQVDFFGSGTVMPDLSHGVVYIKRFNQQTGGSDFYEFVYQPHKEPEQPKYVTLDDFEQLRKDVDALKGKKVKKNDSDE